MYENRWFSTQQPQKEHKLIEGNSLLSEEGTTAWLRLLDLLSFLYYLSFVRGLVLESQNKIQEKKNENLFPVTF